MKIATPPPEKSHSRLSQEPPLKVEILSSPLFENLVGGLTPPPPPPCEEREGGAYFESININHVRDTNFSSQNFIQRNGKIQKQHFVTTAPIFL